MLQFFVINSLYHCLTYFEVCLPKVNTISCKAGNKRKQFFFNLRKIFPCFGLGS